MKQRLSKLWNRPSGQAGLLLVFCFALFFVNLGQWDLWNPEEPRYAQVAREMVNGGDWILMHFNGQIYTDKPTVLSVSPELTRHANVNDMKEYIEIYTDQGVVHFAPRKDFLVAGQPDYAHEMLVEMLANGVFLKS